MAFILFLILLAAGQQPTPTKPDSPSTTEILMVHGTVKDPVGAVLSARIQINVVDQESTPNKGGQEIAKPRLISLDTDRNGLYAIRLPAATYEICAAQKGFITTCRRVSRQIGDIAVNFSLEWNPESLKALQPAESEIMDRRLVVLAGNNAIDCGAVPVKGDTKKANDCARKALRQHKAFHVRYQFQGIDSQIFDGLAFDASRVGYGVVFDSMGISSDSEDGISMPDGSHTIVKRCPEPVKLRKTRTGTLSCFKQSKPFLIGDSMQ